MNVQIKVITKDENLIPIYATELSAGADLRANIENEIFLLPNCSILIPTGLFVEIPKNFEIQIRPRSGLALKNQITVLNTPGTIDSDYRGEVGVILINHSKNTFVVKPKMKIAQMVVAKVYRAEFVENVALSQTDRGEKGFGSSGLC